MRVLHCVLILAFAILPTPITSQVSSYLLVVQWPPGVCTGNSGITCAISPVPTEFKIHGLWPQPDNLPIRSDEAVGSQITPLVTELNKNWPNLLSKQQQIAVNIKFWGNEWNKHGKVSGMGVLQYFQKSLELFRDVSQGLKGKLAAEKITPTNFKTYKLVDIEAALNKIYGFSCTIICVQRKGSTNVQQIQEIRFRFTPDFKKQNRVTPSRCGPDVRFPGLTGVFFHASILPPTSLIYFG